MNLSDLQWRHTREVEDKTEKVLCRTQHFFVKCAKGSIVPGDIMIMPIDSTISYGALPQELRQECDWLAQSLRRMIADKYDVNMITFENGAGMSGHVPRNAHIQMIPLPNSNETALNRMIDRVMHDRALTQTNALALGYEHVIADASLTHKHFTLCEAPSALPFGMLSHSSGAQYTSFKIDDGSHHLTFRKMKSLFMREVVYRLWQEHAPGQFTAINGWDWQEHPNFSTMMKTRKDLAPYLAALAADPVAKEYGFVSESHARACH